MIEIDRSQLAEGIVLVKVHGKLEIADFAAKLGPLLDDTIAQQGEVTGLLLDVTAFDGWDGLAALLEHFRFIRRHHRHVHRVAILGNRTWQSLAPVLGNLFVRADIRFFEDRYRDEAIDWMRHPNMVCR